MISKLLLLAVGVFFCSTSVIMIKASEAHPLYLCAFRTLIAATLLSPIYFKHRKCHPEYGDFKALKRSWIPGIFLGIHLVSWTYGARMTPAANATLIVNLVPVAMPLYSHFLLSEPLSRHEWLGTALAMIGVLILCIGDLSLDIRYVWGDLTCFGSMLLFAHYLALARKNRDFPNLWLYLTPLYACAGIICLLCGLVVTREFPIFEAREWLLFLLLALMPTLSGHSLLNYSMKHLRSQMVAVGNLGQFITAGLMAFLFFKEIPALNFFPASSLILIGALWVILKHRRTPILPHAPIK